jgi:hypothetical protein
MAHRDRCRIQDPARCFGCKTDGIGYDAKNLTRTTRDELGNDTREHRDGSQDVRINAPRLRARTTVKEER